MMKIINVVGARPNFMKMAPIIREISKYPNEFDQLLVHTGQHYDKKMSTSFFDDLGMPKPDINLNIGSGTHAEQTGQIMLEFEKICMTEKPDLVIVVGDVNSTMACTITAKKLNIKVAHIEAGLRSRDMTMPEEINRLCTDVLCDYLFTTDPIASNNLIAEGIPKNKIFFVGNVMIDTLLHHKKKASQLNTTTENGLQKNKYAVLTLHRPSNVDNKDTLEGILQVIKKISKEQRMAVIFPIHPRTKKMIEIFGLEQYIATDTKSDGITTCPPLGYLEFLHLVMHSKIVLTDSGGIQEETTVLGIPCITMRDNTERPITCTIGTNALVGSDPQNILATTNKALSTIIKAEIPDRWDGYTAERIIDILKTL